MYKHIIIKQEIHKAIKRVAWDKDVSIAMITTQLIKDFLLLDENKMEEVIERAKATKKQG